MGLACCGLASARKRVEDAVLWKGMAADQRRELEAVR